MPTPDRLVDFLVAVLPPAAAVLTTLTNVVNLWLAERIVQNLRPAAPAAIRPVGDAVSAPMRRR